MENLDKIKAEIIEFLSAEAGLNDSSMLQPDTQLMGSGLFDSVIIVSLIAFCEEKFDIVFDLTTVDESVFSTVDKLSRHIVACSSQ